MPLCIYVGGGLDSLVSTGCISINKTDLPAIVGMALLLLVL